jgi:hypothetical protein
MNPRSLHFLYIAWTSSVIKRTPRSPPIRLYWGRSGLGATSVRFASVVGRRNFDPPVVARRRAMIRDQFETQLVHVELQALVQITNENDDVLDHR